MNIFAMDFIQHFAAIHGLFGKYGAEGRIDPVSGTLTVYSRNRFYKFYPLFICLENGSMRYAPQFEPAVRSFGGWRPYFNKRWDIAIDKLAFKDLCARAGIDTPDIWRTPSAQMRDFLMKPSTLSFGRGLHGPFRGYDPANAAQQI